MALRDGSSLSNLSGTKSNLRHNTFHFSQKGGFYGHFFIYKSFFICFSFSFM